MTKIKPLGDNVVLKPFVEEKENKSGIVLPETMEKEKTEIAEVIAVGDGKLLSNGKRSEMGVKVGDQVLYKKYGLDEIKMDDQDYLVGSINDILAVIEK
ncbi:MAG: co-chaperone GroES [Patescibacteria group bacterium]|jgi:chaperonin GroES